MEWVPLIGDTDTAVFLGRLALIGFIAILVSFFLLWLSEDFGYRNAGAVGIVSMTASVPLTLLFMVLTVAAKIGAPDASAIKPLPVRADIDGAALERVAVPLDCSSGNLRLLGRKTDQGFLVTAYSLRAQERKGERAGLAIYLGPVSPAPAATITNAAADGRWFDGYLSSPVLVPSGRSLTVVADLGRADIQGIADGSVTYNDRGDLCQSGKVSF